MMRTPRILLVPLALLVASQAPMFALDVEMGLGFVGSTKLEAEPDPTRLPPDTQGAVGPAHVVELLNGRYAAYDKASGAEVASRTLVQFWTDAGVVPKDARAFDPRVVYDPGSERWFAASADGLLQTTSSDFLLAVSRTSDPTDGWQAVRIDSDPTDETWIDFPTIGLDTQGVYLGATRLLVSNNAIAGTSLVVVPKADLLAATPTTSGATVFATTTLETGFEPNPTFAPDRSGPPMTYLSGNVSVLGIFQAARIEGAIESPTLVPNLAVAVPGFPSPPDAPQPGPKQDIEAGASGNLGQIGASVVAQNGSLWAAKGISFDGRAAIQWVEIDEASMTLVQSGVIADAELHFYYPAIAVNEFDEAVIGFSGSSESQFVSAYAVVGDTVGGTTTFGSPILLAAGVADYEFLDTKGQNRWGDYSATVLDPDDSRTFWTFQAFVAEEDVWGIQISELHVGTDSDADGRLDRHDNCVDEPNPGQEDINAAEDDDSAVEGIQHYGDACDIDLDNDGTVASSDFFSVLRPCFGVDLVTQPDCALADLDGDGAVGASDFFVHFRPALGSAPGPGVTEP